MASGQATSVSDVDLFVVGSIDEVTLHGSLSEAEELLGRPVNYTLMSRSEFRERGGQEDGFLGRVMAGPKMNVLGSLDEI